MEENFQKLLRTSKDKFLCYKKIELNIFKYQALKNMLEVILNYQNHYKDKDYLILKTMIIIVLYGLI